MIALSAIVSATVLMVGGYLWWRLASWDAPALLVCCAVGVWMASVSVMGLPRPAGHALLANWDDFEVLSYQLDEGKAIYLWVQRDQPIAYQLPWNEDTARKLHEAAENAKEQHAGLRGKSLSKKDHPEPQWSFYPEPVQPLPPKSAGK